MRNPSSRVQPLARPRHRRRSWWFAAALVVVAVAGSVFTVYRLRRAEITPALRGQAVALKQGCFDCHGADGRGGVADSGSRNGLVPGWDGPTVATMAANEQEISEWILDGQPARLKTLGAVARRAPLIPMPAYRHRMAPAEFADLLVYFRAVSTFGVDLPEPAYEGRKVAARLGCFGCHGPSGIGGSANPGSFKGHIPAWDGSEFPELVQNDAELTEWILNGYPKRLWDNPAARFFLQGQVIGMPAYRKYISADEQTKLVAYFQWLRKGSGTAAKPDDSHRIMGLLNLPHAAP